MEKFGIFELLDALAALASENAPPPQAERNARALGDFLARHERVSKNAGRRK